MTQSLTGPATQGRTQPFGRATRWTIAGSALALGAAGGIHVALAPEHFGEAWWLGALFLLDGIGLAALGVGLLANPSVAIRRAAALGAALTVIAFALSRSAGLPSMPREPVDTAGLWSTGLEAFAVAATLTAWRGARRAMATITVVGVLLTGALYVASPPSATEPGSHLVAHNHDH